MCRILKLLLVPLFFILSIYTFGSTDVFADSLKVTWSPSNFETVVEKIKSGAKVDSRGIHSVSAKDLVSGEYIVVIKEANVDSFIKKAGKEYKATYKTIKLKSLSKGVFIIVKLEDKGKEGFVDYANSQPGVLYVENNVKRSLLSVPTFDDPLISVDNDYSDLGKQWYMNQPENGKFGIDLKRAWEYLDTNGYSYGGESDVVVAVIDTGVAYENYTKYNSYSLMKYVHPWAFGKAGDMTDSIYTNSQEIPGNGYDENDTFRLWGLSDNLLYSDLYCLDTNSDRICDIPAGLILDDVNGFNVNDWDVFWEPDFFDYWSSPYCLDTNPNDGIDFTSFTCLQVRRCDSSFLDEASYFGCHISDMGHPNDTDGHGTFVSNIIAAKPNNNYGGVGIAPGVTIMPIKVLGDKWDSIYNAWEPNGGTTATSVGYGVLYAIDHGADVINLSLGGETPSLFDYFVFEEAEKNGVVVIAASGNYGDEEVYYPAGYETVLAVGASNVNGAKSSYSTYGDHLGLVAPVEENGIISETYSCALTGCGAIGYLLQNASQYNTFSSFKMAGTSFSAPQVSAVAALLRGAYPSWTAEQIRYVLGMSSIPVSGPRYSSQTGYGVLNAFNAVQAKDYLGRDLKIRKRVLASYRNYSDNTVLTSYSDDFGATWWYNENASTGSVYGTVNSMSLSNGNVVQAWRGLNNGIYFRRSSDKGITWTTPLKLGTTTADITLVEASGRIIVAIKGSDSGIYTRYSDNSGANWSGWVKNGSSKGVVTMLYDTATNRLIQAVRGGNDGIYTRYSTNRGSTWTAWVRNGSSLSDITMVKVGNRVLQAVRGGDSGIYIRYSKDGAKTWSKWVKNGSTPGNITLTYTGSRLFETVRGSDDNVYTRYSNDLGTTWSGWVKSSKTASDVSMAYDSHSNSLYQAMRGRDSGVYIRISNNQGVAWSSWVKYGHTRSGVNLLSFTAYSY